MKILFCDWNGTLLNDVDIWDKARRKTFLTFGAKPPTIAEYFQELESGDYLQVYRKRGIKASREELNNIYRKVYQEHMNQAELFPDVKETLQYLRMRMIYLALVTAQEEILTTSLLYKFGIYHLFNKLLFETFDKKTAIKKIMEDTGAYPENCFFVGDSPSDIRHAKKAGITAIAFLEGHIPEEFLLGADYYILSFKEVLKII